MYKIKFQIGEFSKLSGVTVKTLRHYEKIGLLMPQEVDEWTGYRYYHVSQLMTMQTIRNLKQVGFTLEEISNLLDQDCQTPDCDILLAKIRQTETQLQMLVQRRSQLHAMVNSQKKLSKMEKYSIEKLPSIVVASYRGIIEDYSKIGELCVNVIGPEMHRLGCECPEPGYCFTIEHHTEYRAHNIDIEYCEKVSAPCADSDIIKFKVLPEVPSALCVKCYGPYEGLYQHYVDAFAYIEKEGYKVVGAPRASYVDGIWNQSNPDKWLTIVQIPIAKVSEKMITNNRLKIFCCPTCGAITLSYGNGIHSCCQQSLTPVPMKKAEEGERPQITEIDGEYCLEYHHPMTKDNYIAGIVVEHYDKVSLMRLFPEQEALVRLSRVKGVKIYTLYRQNDKVWATSF